jgi:hypothetical protein
MLRLIKKLLGAEPTIKEVHEIKVAGVTATNKNGVGRQTILPRCRPNEPLLLLREPRNPRDPSAIAVIRADDTQLGYVPAALARRLAPLLDRGAEAQGRVLTVTGGTPDKPTFGLVIQILILE